MSFFVLFSENIFYVNNDFIISLLNIFQIKNINKRYYIFNNKKKNQ